MQVNDLIPHQFISMATKKLTRATYADYNTSRYIACIYRGKHGRPDQILPRNNGLQFAVGAHESTTLA